MALRLAFVFLDVVAALQYRGSSFNITFANSSFANSSFANISFANSSFANSSFANSSFANSTFANSSFAESRTAVVSVCHGVTYCDVARDNFKKYCDKHNYTLLFYDNPPTYSDRPVGWTKLKLMGDALGWFSFVFWMDADSLFMNMTQTLDSLQPRGSKQMSMTGDKHCPNINSGHFMLKSGNWSNKFLEEAWSVWPKPEGWLYEQASMLYLLTGNQSSCRQKADVDLCCNAHLVDEYDYRMQNEMNSYIQDFKPGDFILHFAGDIASLKAPRMASYSSNISTLFDKSPLMRKWSPRALMKRYASLALASVNTSSLANLSAFHKDVELELHSGIDDV